MPRRDRALLQAFDRAQVRDLKRLPGVERVTFPGPYGTHPERTPGSAPLAPTLANGPLYTGEWREEINGDRLTVPADGSVTTLATLRRPWPLVGFAVDTSGIAGGQTLTASILVVTRSARARIMGTPIPTPPVITSVGPDPFGWLAIVAIPLGARAELYATVTGGGTAKVRANLWGCNVPGFGP